jgi:hypothetical protein
MNVLYVVAVVLAIGSPMLVVGGGMIWAFWPQPKQHVPELKHWTEPYGDSTACWECGTEIEASRRPRDFRHPLYRNRRHLCAYCEELEEVQREHGPNLGQ